MWILDKADGAANLLSIVILFNWQVYLYIYFQRDVDSHLTYIPIAFKAVFATFLSVMGCRSISKLRNSDFMQTERQLFNSYEIESVRSSVLSE